MKTTYKILATLITYFSVSSSYAAEPTYDPNLLIFAGELRNFFDIATQAAKIGEDHTKDAERAKLTKQLVSTGQLVARVYFSEPQNIIQTDLLTHLKKSLKENAANEPYFVHLGNGFALEADRILKILQARKSRLQTLSILGGAAVGFVGAAGFIWLKKATEASSKAGRSAIAAGIFGGGAAIGFGVGRVLIARLPVDNSIINARDFATRYPHGQDFVKDLYTPGTEAKLRLSLLDSTLLKE